MHTDRRTVLTTGTMITALAASGVRAADTPLEPARGPDKIMEVIHIFADENGVSHVNRVKVVGSPKPLPADAVIASSIAQGVEDWHKAPAKTFTINVVGGSLAHLRKSKSGFMRMNRLATGVSRRVTWPLPVRSSR